MIGMLKSWIEKIVALFNRVPAAQTVENELPHKLNLQFFASEDGDDDEGGDDDQDDDPEDQDGDDDKDDDDEDDKPDLSQMLKDNPPLKKQFNELFKNRFDKRLKGVDLKKAKELLAKEQQNQDDDKQDDQVQDKDAEKTAKLQLKLDRKAKRLSVKEYAADHGQNPKLVARLVDLDNLELNEEGEVDPDDLEEAFESLEDEFPDLFTSQDDDDEEDESKSKKRHSSYRPGSRQRGNKQPKKDRYEAGKQRALARHKKEE